MEAFFILKPIINKQENMPFRCPQCKSIDTLEITASIDLPPDRRSTDISLQVVVCSACNFRGLAVYEECRSGGPSGEEGQHIGYWVSPDAVDLVLQAIASCPSPHNDRCTCQAHTELSNRDVSSVWRGLIEIERGHTFLMRLCPL